MGSGSELWRVRVDLFAVDDAGERVQVSVDSLRSAMTGADDDPESTGCGGDQGLGVAGGPVVGLLFWVRAGDVGAAATLAVETARRAGQAHGVGPRLYDVTVIPRSAVVMPGDDSYPAMPD